LSSREIYKLGKHIARSTFHVCDELSVVTPSKPDHERVVGEHGVGPLSGDRGQSVYDRWSRHGWLYDGLMRLAAPLREDAFEALAAQPGERVLDLGCGPGTNFRSLRDAVGPDGAVVGLDYSPGMIQQASEHVEENGWANVRVVRGDATEACVSPGHFDAAISTFALHTMTDAGAVVRNVHEALRPGGRFVALDSRGIQDWPARLLNPLFERAIGRLVNHQPDQDPLGALRSQFESVEVVETYDAGSGYLAVATRAERC
jgi:demethylmenaquinone methyltransferase/2-methoxy-6-polyprenyl-1,4-benzoquinol methylase